MGRLDDVIARNEARKRLTARTAVWIALALLVVVSIVLLQCTDLGMPKHAPTEKRVDDVLLRSAPARP